MIIKLPFLQRSFQSYLLWLLLASIGLSSCQTINRQQTVPLIENPRQVNEQAVQDDVEVATIALVMKTLTNPFFVEMEKGARRAESELGIRLIVKTAAQETSIEQQIGIIENLIQSKVDAIVIAPGDSVELLPVLKRAQDAGIVIINIDNRLNVEQAKQLGLKPIPFISVNNEKGAYLSAKFIGDRISTPTQVAILEGIRTAQNAADRKNGALRAFQENSQIQVVAMETANWKIDEAYEVTRKMFAAHPDIEAIFCANDMMALGALKYLSEKGKTTVMVAGFDALDDAKQAIRKNLLAVTIDQQAAEQGYLGIHYAMRAMAGQDLPPETMVNVKVISKDSL